MRLSFGALAIVVSFPGVILRANLHESDNVQPAI
jgi:hypothetical protein